MIMDYQQAEQEKYYEDPIGKNKYVNAPIGLSDALTPSSIWSYWSKSNRRNLANRTK